MMDFVAWAVLAIVALPALVLAIELIAAHFDAPGLPGGPLPRTVVLVPAHDEAGGISAALAVIRASLPDGARLIVIADNCTDDTAALARAAGAEVIERHDTSHRGKAFALDFACARLAADPPEVIVVVDADCAVDGDGIAQLATAAQATGRPVQSTYLMRPTPELGPIIALSSFAFLVRNLIRQRALARLGVPAMIMGSGIAYPWPCFRAAPLANSALAEDYTISLGLVRQGMPPAFLPQARTWSVPARRAGTAAQRRRWEQGSLRLGFASAPWLIGSGRAPLIWLGLHMLVPPLALLLLVELAALALLGGLAAIGATATPFVLLAMLIALLILLLLIGWARFGRKQIPLRWLLLIPFYVAWKLPLYAAAVLRPERGWNRTDRS